MFGIFKQKTKEQPPVKPVNESGLKEYAQVLAIEMLDTMQENFRQAQEQRQADYADTVKRHNSLIAAIDVKSYDGPTQPKDLTPYEVLFLWYIDGCTAKEPGIAIYWTYEYNFGDFSAAIDKLLQAGYLRVSDYKFNMQKCTTTELKEVLKQHDLKVSGKKTDLIERLEANVNADVLKDTFSRGYLQLTEAGKLLLSENSHIIYYQQHKHEFTPTLTLNEVDRLHKQYPNSPPEELLSNYVRLVEGEWVQTDEEKTRANATALESYKSMRGTLCAICHNRKPLNDYDICQDCESRGTHEDGRLHVSMLFKLLHVTKLQELEKAVYSAIKVNTGIREAATAYVAFCNSYGLAGRMYLEDMVGVYLNSKHKDSIAGNKVTFYEAIITAKNI